MLFRQFKSIVQAFYALFADSGFAMAGAAQQNSFGALLCYDGMLNAVFVQERARQAYAV